MPYHESNYNKVTVVVIKKPFAKAGPFVKDN